MGPFFLQTKYFCAQFGQTFLVGLNDLIAAEIGYLKGIAQSVEEYLFSARRGPVYRKRAETHAFALGHFGQPQVVNSHLKRVADEKHELLLLRVAVVCEQFIHQTENGRFPSGYPFAVARIAGATTENIQIEFIHLRNLRGLSHVEDFVVHLVAERVRNVTNTAHALIVDAVVEVDDGESVIFHCCCLTVSSYGRSS